MCLPKNGSVMKSKGINYFFFEKYSSCANTISVALRNSESRFYPSHSQMRRCMVKWEQEQKKKRERESKKLTPDLALLITSLTVFCKLHSSPFIHVRHIYVKTC